MTEIWKFSPAASGWKAQLREDLFSLSQSWLCQFWVKWFLKSYHWVNRFCQSCFIGGLLKISWQWCNLSNTDNSAKAVAMLWNSAVRKTLSRPVAQTLLESYETTSSSVCFIKKILYHRLWSRCINQGENRHEANVVMTILRQFKFIYSFFISPFIWALWGRMRVLITG